MDGERFGRLVVLEDAKRDRHGRRILKCRCDCGKVRTVAWPHLRSGATQSCGCLRRERARARNTTHGWTSRGGDPQQRLMYVAWQGIKSRCRNPKAANYRWYGAAGIDICQEWFDSFEAFIGYVMAELGPRPAGKSLDRIRPGEGYCPGNLRWATAYEQRHNRRIREVAARGT